MTLRALAGFAKRPCCRYLQALVILDQSFRNNAERSDLAPEFSVFTLQSSLHGSVNPWLFTKEPKGNENVTLTIQHIRVQFFTWPQPFCSPGPSCAHVPHLSPPISEGSLPGCSFVSSCVCTARRAVELQSLQSFPGN